MPVDVGTSPATASVPPPAASSSPHHHHPATPARSALSHAVAGASAGVIAATFVCPLDVIKTRFQVHGWPKLAPGTIGGSVIVGSLQQIARREGFRGLYRGLSPTILALLPNWAVYFTVYEQLKSMLASNEGSHQLSRGKCYCCIMCWSCNYNSNKSTLGCQDKISDPRSKSWCDDPIQRYSCCIDKNSTRGRYPWTIQWTRPCIGWYHSCCHSVSCIREDKSLPG
ncbi:nicotinamide adenine dinucleotide transporter 1, chloroplastic [Hordeum vulgare]|nr:nicotinamide adenine dinucleotide transporter 1, chloroplastic [Hordeum vulgare]